MSLQPQTPSSAGFWNVLLGGKSNYPVDRALAEEMEHSYPGLYGLARASRQFQQASIEFLLERGVEQFIDLGAGLPLASGNTHEIAQEIQPTARVVYVDNDPIVLAHERALLTSRPEGRTAYLDLDFYQREQVLEQAGQTLDLSKPVGVLWMSTLGHVPAQKAPALVRDYLGALSSGSYLALCDTLSTDGTIDTANEDYAASGTQPYTARRREDFDAIVEGQEVVWPLHALPDHDGQLTEQHGLIIRT
ncbi:SAM-dependent methyltransferase [Streptomyces sp. ODS28]|uniref:SAM-dependent methyltransferase n=1 Tax=Streptomyces sp. ODS28 TaxID=3136688 RepID=UPI0031E9A295